MSFILKFSYGSCMCQVLIGCISHVSCFPLVCLHLVKMATMPESHRKMTAMPDSPAKMAATPEPRHVTAVTKVSPKDFFWGGGYSTQAPADAELGPGLIASVMDPPMMSV